MRERFIPEKLLGTLPHGSFATMIALRLAYTRVKRHRLFFISQTLSVAIALLTLSAIQMISLSSETTLSESAINQLPAGDRAITVSSSKVIRSDSELEKIGVFFRQQLHGQMDADVTSEILFHQISDQKGNSAYFGGVESLGKNVSILSGRRPSSCRPSLCEVLQVNGTGKATQVASTLGLTIVGTAKLLDTKLFSGSYSTEKSVPLLIANGVAASTSLAALSNFQGSNGWVATINFEALRHQGPEQMVRKLLAFQNDLSTSFSGISFSWPQDALASGIDQSHELNQKLGILYYSLLFIFILFQLIFASTRKREIGDFQEGISRIGGSKGLLILSHAFETLAATSIGLSLSVLLTFTVNFLMAKNGSEYAQLPKTLGYINLVSIGSFLFVVAFAAQFLTDRSWKSLRRYLALAIVLISAAVVVSTKGLFATDFTSSLRFTGIAYLAELLICVLTFRVLSRSWRKGGQTKYIFAEEGIRAWQGVSAILGISIALTTSAIGYQRTIEANIQTAVAEKVPLDLVLQVGSSLVKPSDLNSISGFSHLIEKSKAWPILRLGGSVRNQNSNSDSVQVLGLEGGLLRTLPDSSLGKLQKVISPNSPALEIGINIGAARRIQITTFDIPKTVDLVGWFKTPQNTHVSVASEDHVSDRTIFLPSSIPIGSKLVGLEFHETSDYLSRRLHALGEGKYSVPTIKGKGQITSISLDGRTISKAKSSWLFNEFPFEFDGASVYLHPSLSDVIPVVITDAETAALAENSILTLSVVSQQDFKVRIGAIRSSFPSAGNRFMIIDFQELQQIVSQSAPGAVDPTELWISTRAPKKYEEIMGRGLYAALEKVSRMQIEAKERENPSTKNLLLSYQIGAGVALLLALILSFGVPRLFLKEKSSLVLYLHNQGIRSEEIKSALRHVRRLSITIGAVSGFLVGALIYAIVSR